MPTNETTSVARVPRRQVRLWKGCAFRLLAIGLGMLLLVFIEIAFRVADVGQATEADQPSIGFRGVRPLFERNDAEGRYQVAKVRLPYFYPDSFSVVKSPREYRIFCLGGSTVQGNPYTIETAFSTWLELSLTATDPSREWQVVNCGGISYASYRLVPMLKELLAYEPDLFVIYTGHNEFLEAQSYQNQLPEDDDNLFESLLPKLRVYNLLRSGWHGSSRRLDNWTASPSFVFEAEVEALLDYRGGLAQYHRDDVQRQHTVRRYAENLRQLITMARAAGVPILLQNPVSNLKDSPPFKVAPRSDLTAEQSQKFQRLLERAARTSSPDERMEVLEQAVAIDARHAAARYQLAQAYWQRQLLDEAYAQFVEAKDEDICPLRMIEPLHAALREVAEDLDISVLDVRRMFEERSPTGIPGNELLLDHVHPSITGHQMIAQQLMEHLIDTGVCLAQSDWQARRAEAYRRHLATLDAVYFAKGQQRLEGLNRWTQGRVNKLREGGPLPNTTSEADDHRPTERSADAL